MAVQDDLAAALSAISNATNALNTISAQATGAINQVTATYNSRLSTLNLTLYVNQITGSDANSGTIAAPLKSFQAAVDKTPQGGYLTMLMQSDYTTSSVTIIRNKFVVIASDSVVRRRINFGVTIDTSYSPSARVCNGFYLSGWANISMFQVGIIMPDMGAFGSFQDRNTATVFRPASPVEQGAQCITINSCDLSIPATPLGALILDVWPITLTMGDITLIGATTSINGRILRNVTNTNGTSTTTLTTLLTNLATI